MNNKTRVLICLLIFAFIPLGFILINNQSYVANAPEASSSRYISGTAKIVLDDTSNFYNSSTFNTSTTYKTDAGASISLDGAGATIHLHGTCDTTHPRSYQLWIALSGNSTSKTSSKHIDWRNAYNTKYQYCYKRSSSRYSDKANYTEFNDSASKFESCTDSSFTKKSYNTGTDKDTNATFTYTVTPNSYLTTIRYYKNGSQITYRWYIERYRTTFDITYDDVTGYHVAGVYNDSSGSTKLFNANEKLICSGNNTYYAIYQPNTYTIVYHGNGYTGGSTEPSSHTYDTAKVLTSNGFTKTGYRFIGWSTSPNGDVVYSDGQNVKNLTATDGGTVNLYAQWAPITYSVAFDANGGDGGSMSPQSFTYDASQNLTKNSFTRTGHTFAGWKDGSGASYGDEESVNNLTTTNGDTVTLYAQWTAQNLKANFNYNGGTVVRESDGQYYNSNGTCLLKIPTKKEMSRTGYTFKGWSLTPNDTGVYYDSTTDWNNVSVSVDNKDVCISDAGVGNIEFTLYAIWEANDYKINYNLAGGSHGSSHPTTATYRDKYDENSGENDNIINISNPTKKGYTFTGWTASGLSNTAQAGGASWNGTATTATAFKNLTAEDAEDGGTVTLTANWTANTYTINYNLGDDDTYPANLDSNAPKSATYNVAIKIPTPTRVGYVFVGWTLSGDDISDDISTDISTAQSGASDTSLSAWDGGANRNRYFKNLTPDASGSVTMTATWQATIASDIESTYSTAGTYYINTAADLAKLIYTTENKAVGNGYIFIQTANIDLSGLTYLPIGRLNSFSGTYDGQGYTISGLRTYNGTDANGDYLETNGGLFANAGGATITNVIIEDATIYGQNAGIIAGSGNAKSISNCIVSGSVNGKTASGSIIGNGNGANISVCLAKEVNTSSFAGGSASVDSCIYELTGGTKGASGSFNNYSAWIYPSNFAYPMPKAFMWYPYPELTKESLNTWLGK